MAFEILQGHRVISIGSLPMTAGRQRGHSGHADAYMAQVAERAAAEPREGRDRTKTGYGLDGSGAGLGLQVAVLGNTPTVATRTGHLQWEAPATPAEISRLRNELSSAARQVLAEDAAFDLTVATSEVLGNVVRHAYGSGAGSCRLSFSWNPRGVTVVVEDDGDGFRPEFCAQESEGLGSDAESGRGLPLARTMVDQLHCVSAPGGGARVELLVELGAGRDNDPATVT